MSKGARNRALRRSEPQEPDARSGTPRVDASSPEERPKVGFEDIGLHNVRVINAPPGAVAVNLVGESAKRITVEDVDMEGGDTVLRVDAREIEDVRARRVRHNRG
jgi:hypothetical protein